MTDDRLMREDELPGNLTSPCVGCSLNRTKCGVACTLAAQRLHYSDVHTFYFYDPLVYATNRLKGVV
jgi:hypothetical protein